MPLPDGSFDAAISLYTIEHLVWPHRLLEELHRLVRPGGRIFVMTPPFRRRSTIKSINYGLSPRSFQTKVPRDFLDALVHLIQHRLCVPYLLRSKYPRGSVEGRFLINLAPICLNHATWFPDADAVYFSDTREMAAYLGELGGSLVEEWPRAGYVVWERG